MDGGAEVPGGWVAIRDSMVVGVGGPGTEPAARRILRADGCVVTPGFVNTHHHIFQNLTRSFAPSVRAGLFDWLRVLYPRWALLDEEAGAWAVAVELVRGRRMPTLVNTEGEPTVLCQGTYRVTDAAAAAAGLDASLERHDGGHWAEMEEHDGQRVVRATATIEGETLTLSANSEVRFARIKQTVTEAVGTLEAIEETHEPVADAWRRHLGDRARAAGARTAGAPTGAEPAALPPEAVAAMAQLMREREVAWLDEPVPALGGLTPREAADDPTRREDLVALLHEYERTVVPEGAISYDVSRLRQLLGIGGA